MRDVLPSSRVEAQRVGPANEAAAAEQLDIVAHQLVAGDVEPCWMTWLVRASRSWIVMFCFTV